MGETAKGAKSRRVNGQVSGFSERPKATGGRTDNGGRQTAIAYDESGGSTDTANGNGWTDGWEPRIAQMGTDDGGNGGGAGIWQLSELL